LSIWWLLEGKQHRTYQPSRFWTPEFKFRIYWSGSIEKPHSNILIYFYRLELFITTPKIIVRYMKWRVNLKIYRGNKEFGIKCDGCGSHKVLPGRGMAYEPIAYCNKCGCIVWEPEDINNTIYNIGRKKCLIFIRQKRIYNV
jgi:hypothetical protein